MASTSDLLIALVLSLLGLWTVLWLLYAILSPFLGKFSFAKSRSTSSTASSPSFSLGGTKGFGERWRFRRSVRALQAIERALVDQKLSVARSWFPKALFLEWIQYSPELIAKSSHHHLELLNKLIIIAELEERTIRNLPKLESLLGKRSEILTNAFETRIAKNRFRNKQKQKGKTPPKWSTKEFDTKLSNLRKEMKKLHKEIRTQLQEALSDLSTNQTPEQKENHYH